MTIGQLLIRRALPPEMRDQQRVLDNDGVKALFQELATKHPDKYREVSHQLLQIGRRVSTESNGMSVGISDLASSKHTLEVRERLNNQLQEIYAQDIPEAEKSKQVITLAIAAQKELSGKVFDEAHGNKNPLAIMAKTGVRGNAAQVNSLLGADMLYVDNSGKEIPIPVTHNYSEGLTPAEYFAGAFGARKGTIDVKMGTAKSGFMSKQLNAIAHRLLVTAKDQEDEYDPTTLRGLPVETSDASNVGALLAHEVGGYKRNQTLSPRILKDLKSQGIENILVRSPTVGGPKDGGVYAYDTGVRERGGLAPTGDWVGLAGAQAVGETITQALLSSKHSGGVAGSAAGGAVGFPAFNNLVQAPEVFPGAAAHAQRDGRVQSIAAAPQGGTFVTIDGQEHHVPVGRKVAVKQNDEIEAGDMLSDGVPHPAQIVKYKGIGEGRRYFTNAMRQVALASGTKAHRRNIELISRGLINHVRLTDEYEDGVPGETMPYQTLEASWVPRDGHTIGSPSSMKNQFLEKPVLHYTIGTRITPSVVKQLGQYGVKQIYAHRQPPPFEPEMIRAMASTAEDRDWMTNMLGSYQKSSILDAAHRGRSTDTQGSSYVPALAAGSTFGVSGLTKGWDPKAGIDLGPDFTANAPKPIKPLAPSALD